MYTASVESPALVRMGGAAVRARAWYARKMNPKESMRKSRGCCGKVYRSARTHPCRRIEPLLFQNQ
jgi:hypothetical protein